MMKLIRWLLSNILLILIVLVLSYVYVYWDNLTGEDTPAGPAIAWLSGEYEFVGELVAKLEKSRGKHDTAADTSGTADGLDLSARSRAEATEPAPVAEAPPADQQPVVEDKFVTPEIVASLTRVTTEPARPAAETAASSEASKTDAAAPKTTRELWIAARRSYHRRDYENSISSYEKLIAETQDNYDAYGELGNVYFNQGRIKEAAASYYEAAAVLVRLGQVERAASLMGLLGRMDSEKALQLQELIASARS